MKAHGCTCSKRTQTTSQQLLRKLWETQISPMLRMPNYTATAAFKKSTALCHYGSFEVNLAAPPLKVPVLALASGENTKPEVRLELMGYPGVSRGKSWIEQEEHQGTMGHWNVNDFENPLVAINGSMQAYTHMYYIFYCIYYYFICLLMFFPCFPCFYFVGVQQHLKLVFSGDRQTSGVPCVAQWSHFWGHWHHTPCITFVHQCQIQSLCNRRRKFIDEGRFQYQPAMQGVWAFLHWWSMVKSICKQTHLQAWHCCIAIMFGHSSFLVL